MGDLRNDSSKSGAITRWTALMLNCMSAGKGNVETGHDGMRVIPEPGVLRTAVVQLICARPCSRHRSLDLIHAATRVGLLSWQGVDYLTY